MLNKIKKMIKNLKGNRICEYKQNKKYFMSLPYKRDFKNCTLHNAINILHYTNINTIPKQEYVYIMKPSSMLVKGKKRRFSNIKRGVAVANILKECRNNEPVFIVKFNNPSDAENLTTKYIKKYKNNKFQWDLFVKMLEEI